MDDALALVAQMIRNYNRGGSGYTWLDAMIDVVGERGYTILSDNGDADGPVAIFINDETLASTRKLISQLHELGSRVDTASEADLARIDDVPSV